MLKKLAVSGLGLIFLASPLLASADMLGDLQAQIRSLMAQIAVLKAQVVSQTPAPAASSPSRGCPALTRVLYRGLRGNDVSSLQAHLGVSQTGFFGPVTEAAVQKLQMEVGIAAPNTGAPAGYGQVGPRTRAAIALRCGGSSSQAFTASPTSGSAPLTVVFEQITKGGDGLLGIDFGDGTRVGTMNCDQIPGSKVSCKINHTYTALGTYYAQLMYKGLGDNPEWRREGKQVTITVGNPTTNTLSATPVTGSAPLRVTFTAANLERNSHFVVYFGTTECEFGSCGESVSFEDPSAEFTYKLPGTYTAALKNEGEATLGTVTITVR